MIPLNQILCSTGAMIGRPNGRDYRLLKQFCPQLNIDGLEFLMYDTWYPETGALAIFLQTLGVPIPVFHCEKSLVEPVSRGGEDGFRESFRLFEINCALAEAVGAEKLVLHLWNGLISDSRFENNLRAYPELRAIAEKHGLLLLTENVVCHGDPLEHWKELRGAYPDIPFVFDTKMADFHRQLEKIYTPEYAWLWQENHIRHYHVNDYGGEFMDWNNLKVLPIGRGHIDFGRFFAFVRQTGYTGGFTLEATGFDKTGRVDIAMLNEQAETARAYLKQED